MTCRLLRGQHAAQMHYGDIVASSIEVGVCHRLVHTTGAAGSHLHQTSPHRKCLLLAAAAADAAAAAAAAHHAATGCLTCKWLSTRA